MCKKSYPLIPAILIVLSLLGPVSAQNSAGPPIGKYQVRQYMTTLGYVTIKSNNTYEVSGVLGKYAYNPGSGEIVWKSGSYKEWGWKGKYELIPSDGTRPQQHVIRLTSEADGLKMDGWYLTQ